MITRPTVLVLGAGASVDYRFPTGRGLLLEICKEGREGGSVYQFLRDRLSRDPAHTQKFAETLERSFAPSVDRFLEENKQFEEIGKIAIATTLIPYERFDAFTPSKTPGWYETLFHLMVDGGHFQDNNLSILTFNYDRSLEAFFFQALKNLYNVSNDIAEGMLNKIPIIHLYGSLGNSLVRKDLRRGYECELRGNWVEEAAKNIRVVYDSHPGQEFDAAFHLLPAADEIIFLGFGFHPINIQRLQLPEAVELHNSTISRGKSRQRWLACRYGMGEGEVARAKASLQGVNIAFAHNYLWDINLYLKNTHCLI